MRVLVLNAGSSTLKASLIVDGSREATDVLIEWPAGDDDPSTVTAVVRRALEALPAEADAVGYRVVHGGASYTAPTAVDDALIRRVEALDPLAPLHNRRAAAVIRAGLAVLPDVAHVACFDTAFHAGLPEEAWRYPLPAEWIERGAIRRYGFHGLSVAWAVGRAGELLGRGADDLRIVVAHLGSGCSITAVDRGRSLDTSMGMTPYEGPMMGTRSGSVDPGILLELMRLGLSPDELAEGLAGRSGLLAVAGVAGMQDVEARAAAGDEGAGLAIRMFTRRIAAAVAAAATTLPALDAVVFTGGIGEHSARVREDVVRRLGALRLPQALERVEGDGVAAAGPPAVLIVEAREDLVIADEVAQVVRDAGSRGRG
jgi:acetate kinase